MAENVEDSHRQGLSAKKV